MRTPMLGLLATLAACGGDPAAMLAADANVFSGACDAAPILLSCGCDQADGSCLSLDVIEWRDRAPVAGTDGLTVYLVTADDYVAHATPLATRLPDGAGRVVFDPLPAGAAYLVFDDSPGAGVDAWAHTGVAIGDNHLCLQGPALTTAHADATFTEAGLVPADAPAGHVILEVLGWCSSALAGLDMVITPATTTTFAFDAERAHLAEGARLTASSALLTRDARYCSPVCRNLDCACDQPSCGVQAGRGGAPGGFFFVFMDCLPPP